MKINIILICLLLSSSLLAQNKEEVNSVKGLFDAPKTTNYKSMADLKSDNEVKLVFGTLFLFYKKFISSQDGSSCNFTPSCSVYGLQCIQKHGPLRGFLQTFDRLSRCNSLNRHQYEVERATNLLIDPVL